MAKPAFDPTKPFQSAAAGKPRFDPNAAFQSLDAAPQEDEDQPGVLDSALSGAEQGLTLGHADEIAGGARALLHQLGGSKKTLAEDYAGERDKSRAAFQRDHDANPLAYGAGNVVGGIGTQAALTALTGGTSLGAQAALAAGLGAVNAEGDSNADNVGDIAVDAAKGGAEGLAALGVGHLVGTYGAKAVNAALGKVAPALSEKLDKVAIAQGRRVLTGGADSLRGTEALGDDAVRAALDKGAIKAFGTTQGASDRLTALREEAGKRLGGITRGLEDAGVQGPDAEMLGRDLKHAGRVYGETSVGDGVPEMYEKYANELAGKADPLDPGQRLSLTQTEGLKQNLQRQAKYGKLEDTLQNEAKKDIASRVREANEEAIIAAAQAPDASQEVKDLAAQFKPAKEDFGKIASADDVAFRGAEQAKRRRGISLSDSVVAAPAIASAVATGNPLPLLAPVGNYLARTRGASTAAAAAYGLSKRLGKVGTYAAVNPAALGKWGGVLSSALQRGGQDELNAKSWVLQNTDPDFKKHVDALPDREKDGGQ